MRRGARPVGVVALLVFFVCSACRLELDVHVEVAEDGSGAVEVVVGLDPEAVERAGGDLGAVVAVDDLKAAGWTVDGPVVEADGFTRVRIRQPFDTPAEAAEIFDQIAGDDGPFQDFAVTRESSLAETRYGFTGRVDFARGLGGLAPEVDGEPLGATVEEIEAQLGDSLSRLIQVRIRARLPGDVTSNATTEADNGAVWQVGFGEGVVDLEATGTQRRTTTLVLAGLGGLAVLVVLLVLLVRLAARVTAHDRAGRSASG